LKKIKKKQFVKVQGATQIVAKPVSIRKF